MSSTSPRHLPPRASSGPLTGVLFGQAARLRAVVNADLLPRERAAADALVLTAWLSAAQRERYAPSLRAPGSVEEFAERLADERRVVLEEGADPVADEVGAAAEAERGARQIPLRLLEGALLLGALVCVVLTVLRSLDAADLSRHLAAEAGPLLGGMLACLVLAAVVGAVATRRRDRTLLDWAVSRPGQLGRGLPLRRPLQGESAGPVVLGSLGPALLLGAGVLAIVAGAAVLLLSLMLRAEIVATEQAPALLIGGVIALVAATAAVYLGGRRRERRARRVRASEWIGPAPQDEVPPAV
ncbi:MULTISPECIES: hypothetical protein [Brachybacterium]|nr:MULTISPECIES: hypothetical protein [Brachybacterium]MCT1437061.1 hypothetical protein [Brachybacterium paraconglomeratum]GLI31925.1 hypothetical protein BCONGLO52_27660 [Brachybacterium conglomeratum]GLK03458.1 hypothetical protein GCM10017597_02570 [Brachybacterium conglomeratum]